MAPFNPAVQDKPDPRYYLHLSHPIDRPEFKSSTATALKDTGNLIEEAAKGADKLVEQSAEKTAEDVATGRRQQQIDNLSQTSDALEGKQASLVDNGPGSVPHLLPREIQQIPRMIDASDSARASGKISLTHYYADMDKLASDVRGRYPPAYRAAIDKVFTRVTGSDPANATIHSLIGDINSYIGGKDKAVEDAMSILKAHPGIVPNYADLVTGLRSGKHSPETVMNIISGPLAEHYRLQKRDLELRNRTLERTDVKTGSEDMMSDVANSELQKTFNTSLPGQPPRENIERFITDVQSGRKKATPDEQRDMLGAIQAYRSSWEASVRKEFSRIRPDGSTLLTAGSPQTAEQIIKDQKKTFDWMEDAIMNKDTGTLFRTQQMLPAFEANSAYRLLTHKDLGPLFDTLAGIKKLGGDNALQAVFVQKLVEDKFADLDTYIKNLGNSAVTGLPGPGKASVKNFGDAATMLFNETRKHGLNSDAAYDGLFKYIETVKDPNQALPFRQAVADKMFGSDNANFTQLFKSDVTNPNNPKQVIKGAEALFNRFTAPDFVEGMKGLGPEYFNKYVDWVKTSWEKDLAHRALQNLGSLNLGDARWKLVYHDSKEGGPPKFTINVEGQPLDPSRRMSYSFEKSRYAQITLDTLGPINKGLEGLANIAQGMGDKDVDAYVLETLSKALNEVTPGGSLSQLSKVSGLPEAAVKAIQSSREAAEEQTEERTKKSKEEKGKMFR